MTFVRTMLSENWKPRKCLTCGSEFFATDYQVNIRGKKFCSLSCRRHSNEAKAKMSKAKKGKQAWNKGIKMGANVKTGTFFICKTCCENCHRKTDNYGRKGMNKNLCFT